MTRAKPTARRCGRFICWGHFSPKRNIVFCAWDTFPSSPAFLSLFARFFIVRGLYHRSDISIFLNMNKAEIAATVRNEGGHLEAEIKKLQERCERLKRFVLDLEEEIAGPPKP